MISQFIRDAVNYGFFNSLPGKPADDFNQTEYVSSIEKLDKEREERTMVSGGPSST